MTNQKMRSLRFGVCIGGRVNEQKKVDATAEGCQGSTFYATRKSQADGNPTENLAWSAWDDGNAEVKIQVYFPLFLTIDNDRVYNSVVGDFLGQWLPTLPSCDKWDGKDAPCFV